MARAPKMTLKREDYAEVQGDWIDRLIRQLNQFSNGTTQALTRGITFSENVSCFVKTLDVPKDVSAQKPVKVANGLPTQAKPLGILVLAAQNSDGTAVSVGNPAWNLISGTEIALTGFQGQSGALKVTILVVGG